MKICLEWYNYTLNQSDSLHYNASQIHCTSHQFFELPENNEIWAIWKTKVLLDQHFRSALSDHMLPSAESFLVEVDFYELLQHNGQFRYPIFLVWNIFIPSRGYSISNKIKDDSLMSGVDNVYKFGKYFRKSIHSFYLWGLHEY